MTMTLAEQAIKLEIPPEAEAHILYLASIHSHHHLRNAELPRCCSGRLIQNYFKRNQLLTTHSIPRDGQGSICEYRTTLKGLARLRKLDPENTPPLHAGYKSDMQEES